jgi:DNA polymerase III delta subunit
VIDAVIAGNVSRAIDRLRSMFAEDKSAEYSVVGAFAFHFRRMFSAKVMLEKGIRPAEIANRLRIWSNKEGFFLRLRQMSLRRLGENLQQLAETDYAIKTGQTKPQVAIEQLILKLAGDPGMP